MPLYRVNDSQTHISPIPLSTAGKSYWYGFRKLQREVHLASFLPKHHRHSTLGAISASWRLLQPFHVSWLVQYGTPGRRNTRKDHDGVNQIWDKKVAVQVFDRQVFHSDIEKASDTAEKV
jgi:hypothetical protein